MAKPKPADKNDESLNLFFDNNAHLVMLYGEQDEHLKRIAEQLNVTIVSRGNMVSVTGKRRDIQATEKVLNDLYAKIDKGEEVDVTIVNAAVRMTPPMPDNPQKQKKHKRELDGEDGEIQIKTMKKAVRPYSHIQANYIRAMFDNDLVFCLGPAGTGKTYIAVAMAVYHFITGKVERIVLSRPAVEAGEKLGFLPGDMKDKLDPYLRPLYDALFDMMPAEKVQQCIESGEIELAPLAYMRGRTLSNAFVILDEAQNTTSTQMKMFLTRMGEYSRMVITGDISQCDLPKDVKSGLADCLPKVEKIDGLGVIRFSDRDVVRHELAARIIKAYDQWEEEKQQRIEARNKALQEGLDDGA